MPILIVESDREVAEIWSQRLEREGFTAHTAGTLADGYHLTAVGGYDLIILASLLSDGAGNRLLKRLRDLQNEVPVLAVSARCDLDAKAEAFGAGCDDFLCKPFALPELVMRVKALLRRSPLVQGYLIRLADLEIDRLNRRVRRAQRLIGLSPKQFSLLEQLAINRGRILSRSTIIAQVWGLAFEGEKNIVDVYIRQLRLKIDEGSGPSLIRTIRNSGYSIGIEGSIVASGQ